MAEQSCGRGKSSQSIIGNVFVFRMQATLWSLYVETLPDLREEF